MSVEHEMIRVGDKSYPKWAVERAMEVMGRYGGRLESTTQSVLMFEEAKKRALVANSDQPGRCFSHNASGSINIMKERNHG